MPVPFSLIEMKQYWGKRVPFLPNFSVTTFPNPDFQPFSTMFSDFLRRLLPSRPSSPTYAPLRAPQNREDDEKQDGDVPSQGTSSSARVTQYVHMVAGSLVGVFLTLLVLWAVDIQYIRVYRPTVKEFAPTMPLKTVVFDEHRELYGRPSAETNAAWDALMPRQYRFSFADRTFY